MIAGQNEAGKSALLMALRDFDQEHGRPPLTPDYMPEGDEAAQPSVTVTFGLDLDCLEQCLAEVEVFLPPSVADHLRAAKQITVTRALPTGQFTLEDIPVALWAREPSAIASAVGTNEVPARSATTPPKSAPPPAAQAQTATASTPTSAEKPKQEVLSLSKAGGVLRRFWPHFVFFDSFSGQLPRSIDVLALKACRDFKPSQGQTAPTNQPGQEAVEDFLTIANISLDRVIELKDKEKALGNYLGARVAEISGDFLTYWKQSANGSQSVQLAVRHNQNAKGLFRLFFFVRDKTDQYPEQRSKGFVWFLSFYLRLVAAEQKRLDIGRLVLIDEPGTYLHPRAQKDVLHLLEKRLAPTQQVVYSTHSPYLLPGDRLHRLRIALRTETEGTLVLDRVTNPKLRDSRFADTLTPIISAIGLDVSEQLGGLSRRNVLTEGLSDYLYLSTARRVVSDRELVDVAIFPGTGAHTLPTLASLLVGWGLSYGAIVDRDADGEKCAQRLERELGLPASRIVRPRNGKTIEDLLDDTEFRAGLAALDPLLKTESDERPSTALARLGVDKVLLANHFSSHPELFPKSISSIHRLFVEAVEAISLSQYI